MQNTKRSITLKVVAGYLLVVALAAMALWFIYSQVVAFDDLAQSNDNNNEQLYLVSDITSSLYETENISRRVIQTGDEEDLALYHSQIEEIKTDLNRLKTEYPDTSMQADLDSINALLSRKTANLQELLELREQDRNTNYYTQVINELKKVDESFADANYDERFSNLEPHQRRVLIRLLEYAEEDNAEQLTNQTADSLINSVKNVLNQLERANQQFRNVLNEKESDLLDNDMILNAQLRKLLNNIEQEERLASLERVETSQEMLNETSLIIIIAGVVCVVVTLLFLTLIVKDISRSQRYRMQLEEAKTFAESLLKSREQFMAAITHDLRSPLNTVIGYTDLMQKTPLDTKQKHYLEHLKKSSDFILRLVNDLLDLSKLEAGKMLVEKLPFNPKKLIQDTVTNALPVEDDKDVKIVIEASKDADIQVLSDPFRIKQIIANLVTNAYKFTNEGEVKVQVDLKREIEDSYCLIITVEDTGIGISEEKQEEIFEEFSQENSKIEKNYGGSGLGLAITKSLTELLKGNIELESKQGVGSKFTVKIPVRKVQVREEIEENSLASPPTATIDLKGKIALVVDDEPSQLALTQELIKSVGIESDACHNGAEALRNVNKKSYDLVLTDIQMPEIDGFGLVKAMKKDKNLSAIPVIALSGRTNVSEDTYRNAGFAQSLIKPYKPDELLKCIANIFQVELSPVKQASTKGKASSSRYDLDEIFEFSGNDKEAMGIIIHAFLESAKTNTEALEAAITEDDHEKMGHIAHKMLPMLKQMKVEKNIIAPLEDLEKHKKTSSEKIHATIAHIRTIMKSLETEVTV